MEKVRLLTDAPVAGRWRRKGGTFAVVDKPADALARNEVDRRTAEAWVRMEWAVPVAGKTPAGKTPVVDNAG